MARRSYRQNCSLAHAADLLGERWTLLLLRELLIQPCSFGQLADYLPGIGSNLLADRLKELETIGLIEKPRAGGRRSPYQLTAAGNSVEALLLEMIRWGYRFGTPDLEFTHRHHWDLLAMRAFFKAARCQRKTVVQFDSEQLLAWVRVSPDGFSHGMGRHAAPDIDIPSTIAGFQRDLLTGIYDENIAVQNFLSCFILPDRQQTQA